MIFRCQGHHCTIKQRNEPPKMERICLKPLSSRLLLIVLTFLDKGGLETVKLSLEWPHKLLYPTNRYDPSVLPFLTRQGSPLSRSWSIAYTRPAECSLKKEVVAAADSLDGFQEFMFLTRAVLQAKVCPSRLLVESSEWSSGMAPRFSSSLEGLDLHPILSNAYTHLKHFVLHLATAEGVHIPWLYNDLTGLGSLLNSNPGLEVLVLRFPEPQPSPFEPRSEPNHRYSYDQIFVSKAARWPNLHTLYLHNIVSGTKSFSDLLQKSLPGLQDLTLGDFELTDGLWEWFIELFRRMQLRNFQFKSFGMLYSDDDSYGSEIYGGRLAAQRSKLVGKIEKYITDGGRHPSLLEHEDPSMSQRYIQELQSFLKPVDST